MPAKKKAAPAKKAAKPAAKKATKTTKKASADAEKPAGKKKIITSLRGMHDVLPKDDAYWKQIRHASESIAESYGFKYFASPVVEETPLFIRSLGKGTDVIDKEIYSFDDREKRKIALRPEGTAGAARAFVEHGLHSKPQPIKLWYQGPFFRHDRPQAGRYRQFYQFGCETLGGERNPVVDAEIIAVAYNFLQDLGIDDVVIQINSIGSVEDRQRYILELVEYLRAHRTGLSDESKKRLTKNPLRILDSKDKGDQAVVEDAPHIIDWLSDDSKKHFMSVLEYLDELGVPYALTPTLVRGLDYYTDTVFEIVSTREGSDTYGTLASGGRYDGLIEELGGQPTPGCGMAVGLDRVILELKYKKNQAKKPETEEGAPEEPIEKPTEPVIFFAQLGEQARQRALALIEQLRRANIKVIHNLAKSALKAQLELADKHQATHALILGQKETQDETIIIRDMSTGIQEIVDQKRIEGELRKILG